ncbi:unnamed protein product [Somion occarium]|uniref:Carbonic anhydrase n=1 Tax=Somion occarium TaxID=3059160 RepID=A0ABP1CKT4_9APHY
MLVHLARTIVSQRIALLQNRLPPLASYEPFRLCSTHSHLHSAPNRKSAVSSRQHSSLASTSPEHRSHKPIPNPGSPMSQSVWKEFIEPNKQYAANFGSKGELPLPPGRKLAIITCMDARINVYAELGIKEGDAHIIRNAGGSADALRSVIISQRLLGTREIAIFHHTGCGMLTFTTDQLRKIVKDSDPTNPALKVVDEIDFLDFPEIEQSLKEDVKFLKENPLVLPGTEITGWVYEVETGQIKHIA